MSLFSLTSLLFLAACNGDCDNCGDDGDGSDLDNEDCADCPDDTGDTGSSGSAKITVGVYRLDEEVDTPVRLVGENEEVEYTANSGEEIEVVPDTYIATLADNELADTFGFPVLTDQDGEYWSAAPLTLEVENGDAVTDRFDMFNLFEPGDYACSYDAYAYDEDADDFKGEPREQGENLDTQHIEIDENGRMDPDSYSTMNVMADDDYVQVESDHLVLLSETDTFSTESAIGKTFFSLTVVSPAIRRVFDLACERQ